jgi:hypothetical protein
MPFYRFALETVAPPEVVAERLRTIVREEPRASDYSFRNLWKARDKSGPPFVGSVHGVAFQLRRDISGRNSFLPRIRGQIIPMANATRVNVIMFMHPFTVVFMLFWLAGVGYGTWDAFAHPRFPGAFDQYILLGMFAFGVALSAGGFFPEVTRAKHLLSAAILNSSGNTGGATQP